MYRTTNHFFQDAWLRGCCQKLGMLCKTCSTNIVDIVEHLVAWETNISLQVIIYNLYQTSANKQYDDESVRWGQKQSFANLISLKTKYNNFFDNLILKRISSCSTIRLSSSSFPLRISVHPFFLPPHSHCCRSVTSSPPPHLWQRKTLPTGTASKWRLKPHRDRKTHVHLNNNTYTFSGGCQEKNGPHKYCKVHPNI